jgi:hypothetical protein
MKTKVLAVASLFFLCGPFLLAQFEHPDLKSGKKKVLSLVLMPVQAEITKVGMKGAEPMMQESRDTEKALAPVIGTVLQNLGYKLDQESLAPAVLEKDTDLRYVVDDLQKKFDAELNQMTRKSKDVRKGRFTLGDEVTKLPAGEKVDALLFVRAEGQVLTGGKKTFGWLVTGGIYDTAFMRFGVVDSRTGDILYFAKPVALKNISKKTEETSGVIKRSFKNFVKASPPGAAPAEVAEKPATKP